MHKCISSKTTDFFSAVFWTPLPLSQKILSPRKSDKKAGILHCKRMETYRGKLFDRQYIINFRETILKPKYGFFVN